MAKGDWFFKFEIPVWRKPKVRSCSLATRGFWLECIAIMRESGKAVLSGTYEELAKITGCFPDEARACIEELKRYKTADVTLRNDIVTLKSRKYARELKSKELTKLRVRKHRENKDVTPEKRLLETSNKKLVTKEEEIREDETPSPPPAESKPPKPVDLRKVHPAIVGIWEVTGKYPPKEIWDEVIDMMGAEIDTVLLKKCWTKWRARGYNPTNFAWALEWYRDGIPPTVTETKKNGTSQQSFQDRRAELARQSHDREAVIRERVSRRKAELSRPALPDSGGQFPALVAKSDG